MGARENALSVRRYWDEFWTKGNLDAAADFYAPIYRENGVELTPEKFANGAKPWMDKLEDFTAEVQKLFSCGDDVVVSRVRYRAKHVGDFKAVPATGKTSPAQRRSSDAPGGVVVGWQSASRTSWWPSKF